MAVNKDTRWDNIQPGPGRRFNYNYTLVTATISQIDRQYFVQTMGPHLKAGACSNPDMQIFFKNMVTVGYAYRSSDGVFVARVDITPKDCGYAA